MQVSYSERAVHYEGQLETLAETDAEAVSDVDPDPDEERALLAEAIELLQEQLAETVELFAGASSSSCGEIAPEDEVVKEELDAEPVHGAPSMSAEGAKAATALEASKSKPVDPRLIKVKSEATEAVKGMALPQGQRSWQREEATEAAGSTDKGKGQGKEKRQRKERGGKGGGWNTVKRYLEGSTSREPLRQFLRDYPQGHDAAGPTPSIGYPDLNDQHTKTNTIKFYKRQDW